MIRIASLALLAAALSTAQPARAPNPQQLTFAPFHESGIYDIGETVGWTVTPGPAAPEYSFKWTIRRNNAVVLKEGKLDLSSGKDKIEVAADEPAMIYVAVEAIVAPGQTAVGGNNADAQQRTLRSRSRGGSHQARALDAAPGGFRRVLERQACRPIEDRASTPFSLPYRLTWRGSR